ncbi:MAG: ABC transporter permease subunit [Phycisphaeraceae bacterium]|nr:ABC transporter permease subunit [Phycisphaeraceae bacterium]
MLGYIVRRLLFMIPTLIGVTFLVFALVALSPGGLTASALAAAGGGAPPGIDPRVAEAEFMDRFGLDRPFFAQYFAWLGRMSPVKFGSRAQIDSTGDRIYMPRPLPEPFAAGWPGSEQSSAEVRSAARQIAQKAESELVIEADGEAKQQQYRRLRARYDQARRAYVLARAQVRVALSEVASAAGQPEFVGRDGFLREGTAWRLPTKGDESFDRRFDAAREAAAAQQVAWDAAIAAEAQLIASFRSAPFPRAGYAIIPGALSVGAPDLGWSRSRSRPVARLIAEALPITIMLNLIAVPIIYIIAIPSGMLAAARRGSWFDRLSGGFFVALWSIPVVWAGTLMIGFLANKDYLGWFPPSGLHSRAAADMPFLPTWGVDGFMRGYLLDGLWHIAMPVACLVYAGFAVLSRQTRAAMLDNFNADYVRTAKAKGVPRRDVVFRHVFRNSLLPLITMFVTIFPAMLSGAVVVEKIFSIPGMGSLMLDAISLRDAEIMLANSVMVGCVMLLALLLADILYAIADPRVTYG